MVTKRAVIFCGITGLQPGISVTSTYKADHRISIKSEIFAKHLHATATTTTLVNKQANKMYSRVRFNFRGEAVDFLIRPRESKPGDVI